MARRPRLLNIPSSRPFLKDLAALILNGKAINGFTYSKDKPEEIITLTVYLPHRRACRTFKEILVKEHSLTLLPRILPLGDAEDDWDLLDPNPLTYIGLEQMKPVLSQEERLIMLVRLVQMHTRVTEQNASFQDCLGLAQKLALLIDQMQTEAVGWDALQKIYHQKDDIDSTAYWELTLEFLNILSLFWQASLDEKGVIDNAERRALILQAESERIKHSPYPVIAAGSTGSIHATRELLKTIASHEKGAVVLPGLDIRLTAEMIEAVKEDAAHAQHGLVRLLAHLEVDVKEVENPFFPLLKARESLLTKALYPTEFTALWAETNEDYTEALENLMLYEANDEREEALAIALYAKEKIIALQQSVHVITPDKNLAFRIQSEAQRLGVNVDLSQGQALNETPAFMHLASLLRLVSAEKLHPIDILTTLEFNHSPQELLAIDLKLRGLTPSLSLVKERLKDDNASLKILSELEATLDKLKCDTQSLQDWSKLLNPLVVEKEGKDDLKEVLVGLEKAQETQSLNALEFLQFLTCLAELKILRPPFNPHAHLRILGLPEARLAQGDCVVLAGLNEGTFPMQTIADPWLNRKMKAQAGIEPPERRIGLAAHDFVQALGKPFVLITRALKKDNTPTIASRWLLRLKAVLGDDYTRLTQKSAALKEIMAVLEQPIKSAKVQRPNPYPPLHARPLSLSVTEIETLMRNAYAVYAKHILKLKPLDDFAEEINAGDKGSLYHAIIETYCKERNKGKIENALGVIMAIAEDHFSPYFNIPHVKYLWLKRFEPLAIKFIEFDEERRAKGVHVYNELGGNITFPLASGREFTLKGRADRVETSDAGISIIDYKTGQLPTEKTIHTHLSPQLSLLAKIAQEGGFKTIGKQTSLNEALYLQLKLDDDKLPKRLVKDLDKQVTSTWDSVSELLNFYEADVRGYASRTQMQKETDTNEYDHLARVKEWSSESSEHDNV